MRQAKVGEHPVLVIRTATGVYAIDDACPHLGYELVTGRLEADVIKCWWHDWRFRVTDGSCVRGLGAVGTHHVDVVDGIIHVTVAQESEARTAPTPASSRPRGEGATRSRL